MDAELSSEIARAENKVSQPEGVIFFFVKSSCIKFSKSQAFLQDNTLSGGLNVLKWLLTTS